MSKEKDPSDPEPRVVCSPWFPYTGDDPDPWSQLSTTLPIVGYEPRPDPAPHAIWDGYMLIEEDGKLVRYPMRILRTRREDLEADPGVDGWSPA